MPLPWTQLLRFAPEIITISRELMQRARKTPDSTELLPASAQGDLLARVAALEENERRQAELVERMAEQQASLARAVLALHERGRWLVIATAVLAVALASVIAWVALR